MATPTWILVSDKGTTWPIYFYAEEPTWEELEKAMGTAEFAKEQEAYLCRVERVQRTVWLSRSSM